MGQAILCRDDTTLDDDVVVIKPRQEVYPSVLCDNPTKIFGKPSGVLPADRGAWHERAAAVDDPDAPERAPIEVKKVRKTPYTTIDGEILTVNRPQKYPSVLCKDTNKVFGTPDGAVGADVSSWHGDGAVAATEPDVE